MGKGTSDITLGPETKLAGVTEEGQGDKYNIIDAETMPNHIQHGYFDIRFQHDVAVVNVTAPAKAVVGSQMSIGVEVANIGKSDETVEVAASYNGTYIDSENVPLLMGASETVLFSLNTTGITEDTYTINATATVEGDVDPNDNWKTTTIDVKPSPGTIVGTVTDALTGLPIQGANVTANGDYNITDADGHYMITGDPGDYNITASAAGYYSNSTSETIITKQTITVDFELTPTSDIPWHLYVAAAGVVATIIVAVAFYILKIRKPRVASGPESAANLGF